MQSFYFFVFLQHSKSGTFVFCGDVSSQVIATQLTINKDNQNHTFMLRANLKDYFPSEISISLTQNKITIEIDISVHQNYVGTDIDREPFLLSVVVTDVNNHNVQQYRAILWCKSVSLYVLEIMVILIDKRKGKRSVAFMTQIKARI